VPADPGAPLRWLARGEQHLPEGLDWLGPREAARAATMTYAKRRSEFLVARWTAKQALTQAMGEPVAPHRLEIGHAPDGAPVPHLDGVPMERRLSMTDRAGWAVCLLSHSAMEVGCDLELVEPRSPAFVADYLTADEQRFVLAAGDDDERFLRANLVWSAKESALKVLRTGLRRDTRSVQVEVESSDVVGWSPFQVTATEGTVFPGWWQRFGSFVLTVAAAAPTPPPVSMEQPPGLAGAEPVHSWLRQPRVSPAGPPG